CTSSSDTPSLRYQSITQSYFRKAHGVLLLYDISSLSSFLSVRQWIEDIKAHGCLFCETSAKDGINVVEAVLHFPGCRGTQDLSPCCRIGLKPRFWLCREVKRTIGTGLGAGLDFSIARRTAPRCCRT
ncbi:RASEF protein, partial [Gymnorhina tibicen]|nr:RASEF protein [Gymnorhina tibicen]